MRRCYPLASDFVVKGPRTFGTLLTFPSRKAMSSKRKPASRPVETEAKIRVASFAALKRRIVALGGRLQNPRALETNTLFDGPGAPLRASGRSFRVRRYGKGGSVT